MIYLINIQFGSIFALYRAQEVLIKHQNLPDHRIFGQGSSRHLRSALLGGSNDIKPEHKRGNEKGGKDLRNRS